MDDCFYSFSFSFSLSLSPSGILLLEVMRAMVAVDSPATDWQKCLIQTCLGGKIVLNLGIHKIEM